MATATLERMKFTVIDGTESQGRQQLARNALSVLGYAKLAQAMTVPDALLFTLRKLDIAPFVRSKVVAYKDKKARAGMWSGHQTAIWAAGSGAGCLLAAVTWPINWNVFSMAAVGDVGAFVMAVVFAIIALNYGLDRTMRGMRTTREWKPLPIDKYDGNVPVEALSKALAIKNALPDVEVYVDRLIETTEKIERPDRDPFLMVKLGNERYWIDVWDEAKYETFI